MKKRVLGIDVGSNSIGWAIVDYYENVSGDKFEFIDAGCNIFEEGVKIDAKSKQESSRAAERTMYKHMRVGYWRRKIRKIALLKVLIDNDLCPKLSDEELRAWRSSKGYPLNKEFMEWLRTDDDEKKNPYLYRNLCLTEKLNLDLQADRYKLGRAIYHLNQRRGFLSNRKENTKGVDGAVVQSISAIDEAMKELGFEYLGQYFHYLYLKGDKIRSKYTSRLGHYEKELMAICAKQGLDKDLTERLRKIIITQRPLKSQKHTVGHCVFEENKARCSTSHPLFEQFRMYSFINNIKMQGPEDDGLRSLTEEERSEILPLFLRKSKKNFNFEDIAKALSTGKKNYCYYKDAVQKDYKFNYHMDTSVSGCPVTAQLADVFDATKDADSWIDSAAEVYLNGAGKNRYEIMNDIWHALFFFDDEEKLKQFGIDKLQLTEEKAAQFAKINMPSDYASLSLKAIRKILPYMKMYGMIYSHAVYFANLTKVIDAPIDEDALLPMLPREDADAFVRMIEEYCEPPRPEMSLMEYIKMYIGRRYGISEDDLKKLKLYHPSMIDTYPHVDRPTDYGYYQLGSPMTNSMRNPIAMRSLHRIRHVINTLLAKGKIFPDTIIRIEMARELNDSNRRAGIRKWQIENSKQRDEYIKAIKEHRGAGYEPSDEEILKYRLWEEQGHKCLYTGQPIGLADLFNGNKFDIEHTVPRSRGGDTTVANLTLCDSDFNRKVKQAKLPSELANHEDILTRIAPWEETLQKLEKDIRKLSTKGMTDVNARNATIQKRHKQMLERDYWREKIKRIKMTEVPDGFSRRQGVDVGVISTYGQKFLKTVFEKVFTVKGVTTAEFRRIWGLQDEYEKKSRVDHSHHAIDAITIACIGPNEYAQMAQYYHDAERKKWGLDSKRAFFPKPWATFTEDVREIANQLVICHYTADNMGKYTKKRIRGSKGKYMQGDTARTRLHQETVYGAIERDGDIKYVVRRLLVSMTDADVKNIVDDVVRQKVLDAIAEHGSLKNAVAAGIWMNKEKGVRINKVRCFAARVTRPIALRKLRDESRHEHKRHQYVSNDSNYAMGIYIGEDNKGKEKREFSLVSSLDATKLSKNKDAILPSVSAKGYPLRWTLKIGTMVLLYENSPEEIYNADKRELVRRLYQVKGLTVDPKKNNNFSGIIKLRHSKEARPSGEIELKKGVYISNEELRPYIGMSHNQFKGLVEGVDFQIDEDGEIHFLHP